MSLFIELSYLVNTNLISGNVKQVHFQRGEADGFSHRYSYDTDNRITQVETSTDEVIWNKEANYDYYAHGPLARVKTGRDDIDQCDYAYTLHGWLKGVQSQNFAYALGYYSTATEQDYTPIGTASLEATPMSKNLYNGNISTMTTHTPAFAQEGMQTTFTKQFTYDQLNRITGSQLAGGGNKFRTSYSYDANGNIDTLNRWDKNGNQFDAMVYNYHQVDEGYLKNTNRLRWVDDNPATDTLHTDDIEDQNRDNYSYDDIGNLIADASEEIGRIEWTAFGKVAAVIRKPNSTKSNLYFSYDALYNRIGKKVIDPSGGITSTYYILDATGNVLATYDKKSEGDLKIADRYIYGSTRLGNYNTAGIENSERMQLTAGVTKKQHYLGLRNYEFKDHLGNVHLVLSDRKNADQTSDALAAYEYFAGGMFLQSFQKEKYLYGHNTQEKVDELAGDGNHYTAMYWEYDSRLIRRWNTDPKPNPSISQYNCFAGNPIWFSDPLGDTLYQFRPDGSFWRTHDDGKEAVAGAYYQTSTQNLDASGNLVSTTYSDAINFSFNDIDIDREEIVSGRMWLTVIDEGDIDDAMDFNGVKTPSAQNSPWEYIERESRPPGDASLLSGNSAGLLDHFSTSPIVEGGMLHLVLPCIVHAYDTKRSFLIRKILIYSWLRIGGEG